MGQKRFTPESSSSYVLKISVVMTQIGMSMFLMNWAVVRGCSVDSHNLFFKAAPDGHRRILSGARVERFCQMCSGS